MNELKKNEGKSQWELFPFEALEQIARVLTFGAKKHAAHGWRKGTRYGEFSGAAQRHFSKWMQGEDKDAESGIWHLAHCACNILFLLSYQLTKTGTDDRVKCESAS